MPTATAIILGVMMVKADARRSSAFQRFTDFVRKGAVFGSALAALSMTLCPTVAQAQAQTEPLSQIHIGVILPSTSEGTELDHAVAQAAQQGVVLATEEFTQNATMFGIDFAVVTAEAEGPDVIAAAEDLLAGGDVFAIAGGFDAEEGRLLSQWANENTVPFVNLFASDDRLRNELCAATSFHVAPSSAMYLDALTGWYVRAGLRNWFVVRSEDEESAAQYERLGRALSERHFGAREVGHAVLTPGVGLQDDALDAIAGSGADVVVLLSPAQDQLDALVRLEKRNLDLLVTGFPHPQTQTRTFFAASRDAAPVLGVGMRALAWEPTLDAYGARELNARYMDRWDQPMESAAWAGYQGIKVLFESAMFSSSTEVEPVLSYLAAPGSVFDVWKGIGTSFRPWDHQLRQPLYLSKIDPAATETRLLGQLVGELPAIYMPGTEPVERLDQIGDLPGQSQCRL
ncbi:ABC transporter substrate-binding protein [Pontivivens nitratireducens]|uniref:ABC transporter substrate-binding protein n=1 Tax=Pontivivens nitratireducens TaxID=2758038 RepID=A0A6G7VJ92_9RHOB|nr:ABC transporter substrate-binding protein [Pontibrevibacter nitratireducens]QIK39935.1 ABC transporter substrate-binding protein [Pontibrevibacter nitratireducens]